MSPIPVDCFPYGVDSQTGICLLLRLGSYRILLDCGLPDISPVLGGAPQTDLPVEPFKAAGPADYIICSQAHPDYVQGVWALHQTYPHIPIYASAQTHSLLNLWQPQKVETALPCQILDWQTPLDLSTDLTLELLPAGHLPGAAMVLITYTEPLSEHAEESPDPYTVLYTGACCLTHTRLAPSLPIAALRDRSIDLLLMDGGYGTGQHPPRKQQESAFIRTLLHILGQGKSILMPLPTLGLGQEILMLLRSHADLTHQAVSIWVDAVLARGCDAYEQILPSLPLAVQNFAQQQSLFWQAKGWPQVRQLETLNQIQPPCIILVHQQASLQEYAHHLGDQVVVMNPTYPQDPGTRLTASVQVQAEGQTSQPPWETQPFLLAQHCDSASISQLIHNIRPDHVAFFHSTPLALGELAQLPELRSRYHLHILTPRKRLDFDQDALASLSSPAPDPPPPMKTYSGEVHESDTAVGLSLTADIMNDPRWEAFADTGLVESVWQGNQLVIRGLSQTELLQAAARQQSMDCDRNCCATCRHYQSQRCWQPHSALYGFKVTPQGYCPVYDARACADDYKSPTADPFTAVNPNYYQDGG